jgi:hypothetical protein
MVQAGLGVNMTPYSKLKKAGSNAQVVENIPEFKPPSTSKEKKRVCTLHVGDIILGEHHYSKKRMFGTAC